jgi:putative heme degradation protein
MKADSETQFMQQVTQLAQYYSWRIYHTHDSRRSPAGFPDLVLVRPPELIFAELKTEKGRVRPEQADWLADLEAVARVLAVEGVRALDVCLWRPSQFDEINARLARGRVRQPLLYRDEEAA